MLRSQHYRGSAVDRAVREHGSDQPQVKERANAAEFTRWPY